VIQVMSSRRVTLHMLGAGTGRFILPGGGSSCGARGSTGGGAAHPSASRCRCELMRPPASEPPIPTDIPITVVVARFDDLFARGLRELVRSDRSLAIVAEDVDQRRVGVVLRAHRPNVAILDARALVKFADVRELTVRHPSTRLVVLGDGLSSIECAQLLAFGASACLGRDTQARDVLNAIHLASRGLQVTPRASGGSDATPAGGQLLTRREAEVLPLLQQGATNPQIADALGVGVETVRTHARNIYRKLGVSSRAELVSPRAPRTGDPPSSPRRRVSARRPRPRRGHDARYT
jgi:DNA-binding NarL/FixJ family response regulator